jgi:hypothetical protein
MSLTKVSFSMINGSTTNVVDYGADPTGSNDSTVSINAALAAGTVVYIPQGTYRIDGAIIVGSNKTLLLDGTLSRLSAYSTSTRPVVILAGNYVSFKGNGLTSVVNTQNNSPNGVVLWGSESPQTVAVNYRFANVSDLQIACRSDGTGVTNVSNTLSLQNSQFWLGGALYDGIFQNLHLFNGGKQVYLNAISNGNTFNNIDCWNTRGYTVYLDGISGGLITDNVFCNFMIDGSPYSTTSYYGRYVNNCSFVNCGGEPGAGNWVDFDSTCSSLFFQGYDNHINSGNFLATNSTFFNNGQMSTNNLSSTNLNIVGGTASFSNSSSGSYNGITVNPEATAYGGAGGVAISPNNTPGSGTAQVYTWFQNSGSVGALTQHNVVIDGYVYSGSGFQPKSDNTAPLGGASSRFTTVYATTGTINTSDANQKQQFASLSSAEIATAKAIKGLFKTFKFNEAVSKKGVNARTHIGVSAQDVQAAFTANGLDATKYGIFCSDTWYVLNGAEVTQGTAGATAVTQLGVRYEELLAFVIAAM